MDPTLFVNRSKKARVDWSKKMLQKYDGYASKHVYHIVTGDESWIYAYEPESKPKSTVWVFQDEPNPTKVTRARSTSNQIIACFFGKTRDVAIVPLEQCRTINSEWYTTIIFPVVFQEIRKANSRRRITLQHDNASTHTSAQTTAFLSTQNIDLKSHPPYSHHLVPNGFFLFPYVINKMRGQSFPTPEEAVDAFRMLVLEILVPQSGLQKCFNNWFKHMQKCIDHDGEYFEKQ